MGKEKRLFLLAVMTVMMSTVGYSKEIEISAGKKQTIKSYTDGDNYKIIAGSSKETPTKVVNETNMTFKNGVGIKFEKNKDFSNGKIEFTNKKNYKIEINAENADKKVTGISVGYGKLINAGEIKVNGEKGLGIYITTGGAVENKGKISVENKGLGLQQKTGQVTNSGLMKIESGAKGLEISGGEFTNTGTGENGIQSSGIDSVGIEISGGTVNNIGLIKAENGATGIKITNGTFNNATKNGNTIKAGTISSLGKSSIGLLIQESEKGTVNINNEGYIKAEKGAIGVKIEKGTFTNSGLGPNKGIFVSGAGSIGIDQQGGTVVNDGKIETRKDTIGVKVSNGATFINNKQITGPKGIGVALENGTFINTGEVTITDTDQVAIKSLGGNNTVYLKNGSKVTGKIVGADGIDVLGLGAGTYKNLDVSNYEAIAVRGEDVKIEKSIIGLEYNKGTKSYFDKTNNNMNIFDTPKDAPKEDKEKFKNKEVSGNLTIADTTLAINFKDALTNGKENDLENPIINVGKDGTLTFEKGITLVLDSSDGSKKFDIYEALGFGKDENGEDKNGELILGLNGNIDEVFNKTAVWDYYIDSEGHLTAEKESYDNVISKSQLKDFASLLDKQEIGSTGIGGAITALETLKTQEAFTNAVTQMSGGVHGYIVDFAALNARTLTNTMRNRALTRDYMRKRPLNSWTQDISYIDNNHRLGGLMNVDYTEKGVLGISEKQILPNGRIGLVYGGSKGNAKFENGANGSSSLDGAYFGGYYNHEFNDKWSLNSNANFVYTHNKVTRNVDLTYGEGENKVENPIFKSAYPTYTVGMGTSLIYTVKDDLRNKAHFYAGVDVERIMVGNINENKEQKDDTTGLAVKTNSYGAKTYYSIVPSAGFMVQNTGYVFDRKYRIGADLNWETEVGNIKDGKRIKLTGLDKEYKIETSERENVFSYSLFGALDLTESLSVNARYTSMFSDEYDADMIGAGFEYKMDTMADNFFGTLAHKIENNRPFSDRWGGTFGIMMESDDADDSTSFFGGSASSGDSATSNQYKPKMTLSLNDKQSNWSYYFEAYHKTNDMFGQMKSGERDSHASRYHGEARWNDTYSKGTYGVSLGYRNENSDKPYWATSYGAKERIKRGVHELRITPSFSYDLGHGFTLGGKSAIVFMYNYDGYREGQLDLNTESQIGLTYTGFMPRWLMTMNFYREDTWYDHGNRKQVWTNDKVNGATMSETLVVPKRDQVNQLRPSVAYFFGNGASFRFDARIPLGNGTWADNLDGTNGNQAYEVRYGFNYFHPVTPGLTLNVGGTFLNNKTKNKTTDPGKITRSYAFRPNIGFYYSF